MAIENCSELNNKVKIMNNLTSIVTVEGVQELLVQDVVFRFPCALGDWEICPLDKIFLFSASSTGLENLFSSINIWISEQIWRINRTSIRLLTIVRGSDSNSTCSWIRVI